jgi:hypothetical protein
MTAPRRIGRQWRWALAGLLLALCAPSALALAATPEVEKSAVLIVIPRELLFFSAQVGQWTSVRLDPGERIFQRAADGNVAAVVTSKRAVGFSAPLNTLHEISLPEEETVESFKVEGNAATILTRRRALGFSAQMGRWSGIERFQLGP